MFYQYTNTQYKEYKKKIKVNTVQETVRTHICDDTHKCASWLTYVNILHSYVNRCWCDHKYQILW